MNKSYLVVGAWYNKENGQPQSRLAEVSQGTNQKGKEYAIADADRAMIVDGFYPLGKVLVFTMSLSESGAASEQTPAQNIKLNRSST